MKASHVRPCFAGLWLRLCVLALFAFQKLVRPSVGAIGALLIFFLLPFQASAVVIPDRVSVAFDRMLARNNGAGIAQIAFGGSSGTLATPGLNATLVTDGGLPLVTRTAAITNPVGNVFDVTAKARIPSSAVAVLVRKALPLVPILGIGISLYDFAKELGYTLDKDGSQLTVTKQVVPVTWTVYGQTGPDAAVLVQSILGTAYAPSTTYTRCYGISEYSPGYFSQTCQYTDSPSYSGGNSFSVYGVASGTSSQPATLQELENAIAAKSSWPTDSKISQAIADAQSVTGDKIQTSSPTITGPATSPGTTSTVANADGTTTTTTTNYNHTYQGDNISTTSVTVVNNYNPVTNTTTTETKTESPVAKEEQPTDCDKYPDSAGCADLGTAPTADTLNKTTQAVSVGTVSFASGGSCPAPLTFSVIGQSYGVSYQPLCDQMFILRALFLAMAGVLAAYILADSFKV